MKFHLLYASSVSACFELENANPYYAETAYDVTVNGAPALLGVRTNVFSLFDLEPEKEYSVSGCKSNKEKTLVRTPNRAGAPFTATSYAVSA